MCIRDSTSTDYPYRATLADTADKISAETLGAVGLVLETWFCLLYTSDAADERS